jgi:DNA helicase-2/ATP-dependent DNA helicase PcrA
MSTNSISADQVFFAVKRAEKPNDTTDWKLTTEQREAVELAPTDAPTLVVAGAGSGKTELMAVRVLWLVANGHAEPGEILGLTFTRKAASELSARINSGLRHLAGTSFWPKELADKPYAAPNISTYNAYANSLFQDHALALGYEPDSILLTEAARFQLAREVVLKYSSSVDARINEYESPLSTIVDAVLSLAGEMADNGVDADQINDYVDQTRSFIGSLKAKNQTEEMPIPITRLKNWQNFFDSGLIANLAQKFREEKLVRGMVDYSDQVALAARAVETMPELVAGRERSLYKHVLLDEYQDTSTLQTRLLRGLFAQHSVFAVGDPNQSIYGWRGASASNLREFITDFGTPAREVVQFPLPTSWRNPSGVLNLANRLLEELHHEPDFITRGLSEQQLAALNHNKIKAIELTPRPGAPVGDTEVAYVQTQSEEATAVASWFARKMQEDPEKPKPTAALLLRTKGAANYYASALSKQGVPYQIVGVAGLLEMPEIVDLVAALKVVHNPTSGASLLRLLAGPRWRIGAKDIQQLYLFAKKIASFDNEDGVELQGEEVGFSIVDALDELLDLRNFKSGISETGLVRMKNCAKLFRKLRSQTGLALPDFVRVVEQELWLDIELTANPNRLQPMANLNSFANVVTNYANSYSPTLGGFLEWLEYAASKESFETPSVAATPGEVQILTVHASKGLEWDLVSVPLLIDGTFPSNTGGFRGWVSGKNLPYHFRGDAESLPKFDMSSALEQTDIDKLEVAFNADVTEYKYREERRLAYVAVTRAKKSLMLSASVYKGTNKSAVKASPYLTELAGSGEPSLKVIGGTGDPESPLPALAKLEVNPDSEVEFSLEWPMDPLGPNHRVALEKARDLVDESPAKLDASKVEKEINLLLDDLAESVARASQAKLPVRIPASRFKEFLLETEEVAELYRRPVPREPFSATMAGTLFHTWVEERFQVFSPKEELDIKVEAVDDGNPQLNIEELKAIFEESRFASMEPADIECEIQVTIKSNTFICKIDAVFKTEDGFEIVDWKTGIAPTTPEDIAEKALQLALYRMAYAKFHGVDPDKIGVCLYYVNDNLEIKPEEVKTEDQLLEMWQGVLDKVTG